MRRPSTLSPLSPRRQLAGWVAALVGPLLLTVVLSWARADDTFPLAVLLFLTVTVTAGSCATASRRARLVGRAVVRTGYLLNVMLVAYVQMYIADIGRSP